MKIRISDPIWTDPDHVYFNMTYFNDSFTVPTTNEQYILAKVQQTYDRSYLDCPQDWNVCVARFAISSDYISRVYQTPTGVTAGNTTFYVGLEYNGVYYDSPVVIPPSLTPDGKTLNVANTVYDFLDVINAAFATSTAALVTAGGPTGATGQQVIMEYDPSTGLYQLAVPAFYGTGTNGNTGNGVAVTMSYALYHRFMGFSIIQNVPLLYNNHDVTFVRAWRGNNLATITYPVNNSGTGSTGNYMILSQDREWASSIMDVTRLLILTNSLPTVVEYRADQLYSQFLGNAGNNVISILTDFLIGADTDLIAKSESFQYSPTLYRLVSLKGTNPLNIIDIQVYVATNDGRIFPLYLSPYDSIDVKIAFIRKGLTS